MVTLSLGWLALSLCVVLGAAGCSDLCGGAVFLFGVDTLWRSCVSGQSREESEPTA